MGSSRNVNWRFQPPKGTQIDWTSEYACGLELCVHGDFSVDMAGFSSSTFIGTKVSPTSPLRSQPYGSGPALGFFGSGVSSTDKVTTKYTHSPLQRTYLVTFLANSTGGNGFGRLVDKSSTTVADDTMWIANISGVMQIRYGRNWSGGVGQWYCAPNSFALGTPCIAVVAYDGSSSTNQAAFYVNGTPASSTVITAPSGSLLANSNAMSIGNNVGGSRYWDGYIGLACAWNRCLQASEALAICANPWQLFASTMPRYYKPNGLASFKPHLLSACGAGG